VIVSLRKFGIGLPEREHLRQWLFLFYWGSFLLFVSLDSFLTKVRHPVPILFGPLHPERIYEKFATQERAWQLLLVLMLPVTARLVGAITYFNSVR
jgi:hypothetical protein